jgi:peptidoglycan/LPS O-acetylase OafA/YrhL
MDRGFRHHALTAFHDVLWVGRNCIGGALMQKIGVFTKVLAIAGALLVSFPILAPVVLTLVFYASEGIFRFDYLMPAELFLSALLGGILLIWAALRAHRRLRHITWSLSLAVIMLVGGQVAAVLTGLASGAAEPVGWRWALVAASLGLYVLMLVVMAVGGFLLVGDCFRVDKT